MKNSFEDHEVIARLNSGDDKALYQLYDKYSGALFGVILRMCRDKDKAEDLLQETFIKIWKNIAAYDASKGRFYTWAYRIARNTTLNSMRTKNKLIQTNDLSVYDTKEVNEELPNYTELKGSIKALEPHHQKAIALVYYSGYTHKQAHKAMGVPLGTFKSYIRQALKQLRETYTNMLVYIWVVLESMA
ncbi:RNA polymerase sigma factor [Flagellimonas halotolerans]|uniref:RNA polymerase sigma factor n=1 Tax=Flagellimonas halotolerans TaxID=3112164 RepID=A0ABU6IRS8_9FLAO|nr:MULTISPECIES: RNA polymerase sigma factor [unclassified Allomuricauda]MEC3966061.1 RNA polymerase sigma factor [Muricauda sp. SYSU M86414]MEC4265829.1 RNA polymerase sigma factor [Muricauda sp. SYSU M84420]